MTKDKRKPFWDWMNKMEKKGYGWYETVAEVSYLTDRIGNRVLKTDTMLTGYLIEYLEERTGYVNISSRTLGGWDVSSQKALENMLVHFTRTAPTLIEALYKCVEAVNE